MARRPRLHVPGGLYHVTLRGNHRQPIFDSDTDRMRLASLVADATDRDATVVHAFCWMTNHIHVLIEVGEAPLGHFMHRVASQYARFMQPRLETTGHLFERRYHAVLVDTDRYLLDVVRYIHLNPVRVGLVAHPDDYPWSSHRDYLGLAHHPWVHTQRTLAMLAADCAQACAAYAKFVVEGIGAAVPSPLASATAGDRRVLGGEDFLRRLTPPSPCEPVRLTLDVLIERTCDQFGQPVEAVRSAARNRRLTAVRVEIARRAVDSRIATRSEVARALGRSVSAISQALEKARRSG